jgi:hypothetical protein
MKKKVSTLMSLLLLWSCATLKKEQDYEVDICVYGGTSAGIIAAYTAKQLGKSVVIIEPSDHLGGLTTGGLGATDIGNKYAVTGIAKEFYRRIGKEYGKFEQWTFEPHVAEKVYQDFIQNAKLDIVTNFRLTDVDKKEGWIQTIAVEDATKPASSSKKHIKAKMFIDATYEGDLMAKAGVSYTIGREANTQYGETWNGVQLSEFHQFPLHVDPYMERGNPKSGLVWGVTLDSLKPTGSADNKIQAYNFRLCLTQDPSNFIPITKPEGYDVAKYELLARILEKDQWESVSSSFKYDTLANGRPFIHHSGNYLIKAMPNGKTDVNNFGGFSTDMIGANYDYPEGDYETRKKIWKAHQDYTKGLLYFMVSDDRVPAHIRKDMQTWGYTKDEFKKNNGFSTQLYVREARRMVSDVVMNENHCIGKEVVNDQIGMAAYGMDSHNIQRIVVDGMVQNEGDVQKRVPYPFPISYRSIVPKKEECKNLYVPVCLSASHIAFGSIRMEPVFMVLGQSAATAAVMAIDGNSDVQSVNISALQKELQENPLADRSKPEMLIDNDNKNFVSKSGNWELARGGYGRNHFSIVATPESNAKVVYTTPANTEGEYEVWMYFSTLIPMNDRVEIEIKMGDQTNPIIFKPNEIKQFGLASGDWVSLGKYILNKNNKLSVSILGKGISKKVVADAIIFKPI